MKIMVRYQDNSLDTVEEFMLEEMIWAEEITAFRRASGWVIIGRDRLRDRGRDRRRKGRLINVYA